MREKLRLWWTLDVGAEERSADNPFGALRPEQRRSTGPMLALAFGWGFLITGLFIGGLLGAGQPFWPEMVWSSLLGNGVNFVVGALVGYMGYRTGCNSGLLFRMVYGNVGALVPVLFLTALLILWQGITVGAFSFAWVQDFTSPWFYAVAIFAGLLYTWTTYFGVKGLEKVALPASLVLVTVLVYAGWYNITEAGGWTAFLALSRSTAARSPLTTVQAMNIVIGSWIVGAVVMAEYTRFARQAWVAIAIPFIVLVVTQWILQFVGAMGGVVSGNFDFTVYMRSAGSIVALFGLVAMSFALWTTGDANLYLPSIQTASVFRRPKRVMVVICGLLGTLIGLGIYQRFMDFINVLASIAPPLIGPVIVDYYLFNRMSFRAELLDRLPAWNPIAVLAFATGAGSSWFSPDWIANGLFGLLVSMLVYGVLGGLAGLLGVRLGHAKADAESPLAGRASGPALR
ncbi:MAG: cytosine permease [Gammaproteobacteria bacterium]